MKQFRATVVVAVALAAVSGTAAAQAKTCDINQGSPFQVNGAKIYLNKVLGGSKEDEKPSHLRNAIKVLTENPEKINNQLGRQWLLGKSLVAWIAMPKGGLMMKRADMGYTDNPEGMQDVLLAADSAFTYVERNAPQCADSVRFFRRQPWAPLINRAIAAANAQKADSAEYFARRAMSINREGPHAWNVIATVATQRNDQAAAMAALKEVIAAAGNDTAYAKLRHGSMYNLAVMTHQRAEVATGEEKTRLTSEAAQLYQAYLKEVPGDANAAAGLARALGSTGNTAAVAEVYADMLKNPAKFSDLQLFEAGSLAARAKRNEEAAQLFDLGLRKNPYFRDALFNISTTYFAMNEADKMEPFVKRLVEVDPNNPDNWRLYAGMYQIRNRQAKAEAAKKSATDSLLKYVGKYQKLPAKVTFSEFSHAGTKHTLVGEVENLSSAAASYTLKVEFLDASGNVVATETARVGPVAPRATAPVNVTVTQSGIAAYRYAPLGQ